MTNIENVEEKDPIPPTAIISSEDDNSEFSEEESSEDRENREDNRFKEGQILRFVRVRFPGNSKSFSFLVGKRRIEYGQKVVAMSDRDMAVGYVNSFPYELPFNKSMLPVRSISKVATDEDIVKDKEAYQKQKDAENICNDLIEEYRLDMHLTHVEFTSFGKKAVFYFIAPARVDFRDLVKALVGQLKTRIELRQISVRDRSASVGGIGPCGLELCCSSFLTKYGNVGIKMAKNQDLTLNFSKLNGVCGQLKCCLGYEDEVYREKRAHLPKEGDYISTHSGEFGRVDRLHLLNEQFMMMTNRGIRKRYVMEMFKDTLDKEKASFPNEFDSVSDETFKVIGLDEREARKAKAIEEEVKALKEPAKKYADSIFEDLFGEKSLDYALPDVQELASDIPKRQILSADEEEEIEYKPSEDELLPDDDESLVMDRSEPSGYNSRPSNSRDERPRDARPRNEGSSQGQGQNRNQNQNRNQGNRNQNQGQRNPQQGERPQQNRPRNEGSQNRGPNPNSTNPNNQGRRPR